MSPYLVFRQIQCHMRSAIFDRAHDNITNSGGKRTGEYFSWFLAMFESQNQMRSDFILPKNPTNALCMLTRLYSRCYTPTCFSPLGPSAILRVY